ncbi:MAG: hypothetical protein U5P10_13120 [Spirochaetia bacterium]|nr:hypothetical protein [Spirochaetia bacterium]
MRKKRHVCWILNALDEEYTVETTLGVYCLNPTSFFDRVPENVLEVLRGKGYTRLYVLYLFSRIGNLKEFADLPVEELLDAKCNESLGELMPEVGKIFFAYGTLPNENMRFLVEGRVEEVKSLILQQKPEVEFYHFGGLTETGDPKSLEALEEGDSENRIT